MSLRLNVSKKRTQVLVQLEAAACKYTYKKFNPFQGKISASY